MTTYTIGELSRRTGVPAKTIRFYHEERILEPHGTTEAGYRLYTSSDEERLNAIRSFRALGFSLDAIRSILDNPQDARTAAQLQLHVLQTQLRALRRQEAIVHSALRLEDEDDIRRRLQLANAAAGLAAEERQAQIDAFLQRVSTRALSESAKIRQMALLDLPDELEPEQLEAWIELSTLLRDESFIAVLVNQQEPFKNVRAEANDEIGPAMFDISAKAQAHHQEGAAAGDERVQGLVDRWTSLFARALEREPDEAFLRWFLTFSEATGDVRIERFWQLVARLRGCPPRPFHAGLGLLIEGLRARLTSDMSH